PTGRGRHPATPPLIVLRRQIFAATNDGQLAPYDSWSDFGQHLKHPESLINFIAAYGTHPSITSERTIAGRRAAATAIVEDTNGDSAGNFDFMFSQGAWAQNADGSTTTRLDEVHACVGGLREVPHLLS